MSGDYRKDREFGDKFMPEVKAILGQFLLSDKFTEEDCERNTDLIVLGMEKKRIGVRIRRHTWLENYGDEFTIRCKKVSGCKTEFDKVMEGWGDYFFYGFADKDETHLEKWIIGDYDIMRRTIMRTLQYKGKQTVVNILKSREHTVEMGYGDSFYAFKQNEFHNFVVASSDIWNTRTLIIPKENQEAIAS